MGKIAKFLGISSVNITQVLKGNRDFTEEQAIALTRYLSLPELEREYFIFMVLASRSGNKELEGFYRQKMQVLCKRWEDAKNRVVAHKTLDESQKAVYYSDWRYSAVRLSTSLASCRSVQDISQRLGVSEATVTRIADFLINNGLCTGTLKDLVRTDRATFIDKSSPLVNNHHRNWRTRALQVMEEKRESDLFYTSPVSISRRDREKIRKELVAFIEKFSSSVQESDAESLLCLNIDWFEF